jgi:hypothetical protein
MTPLVAHGITIGVASPWEARISRRTPSAPNERTFPVLHAATFPLPEQRDDFGGGVTTLMRPTDVFVSLFEYGPDAVGRALFAHEGVPRVHAELFGANRLQRPLPGQLGCQQFFTDHSRAFCLYVVAGSRASLPRSITMVNTLLGGLEISP